MARVKLSEFQAKQLLFPAFELAYSGLSLSAASPLPSRLPPAPYVLKVDQGVKKRGLQGLVKLNLKKGAITPQLHSWSQKGWSSFLLESFLPHAPQDEHYLSLTRLRNGWDLAYSPLGGIEIESHFDTLTSTLPPALERLVQDKLIPMLDRYHLSFVEFNPLVLQKGSFIPLDLAAEIDSAALTLSELAPLGLAPVTESTRTSAEKAIAALDASTPASLKFKSLNQDGRIWVLLSGGGASLVLADEVADLGLGGELANYGEYSGAPSTDDTYAYTKIILQELLKVRGQDKFALVIAGGVANFTDVAKTFAGIIRALAEFAPKLKSRGVKVFVRRGGPNEEQGLKLMEEFLQSSGLFGSVHGSTTSLTQVIKEVKKYL